MQLTRYSGIRTIHRWSGTTQHHNLAETCPRHQATTKRILVYTGVLPTAPYIRFDLEKSTEYQLQAAVCIVQCHSGSNMHHSLRAMARGILNLCTMHASWRITGHDSTFPARAF